MTRPYLFVTVGTTGFDSLIRAIDSSSLVADFEGHIQIGSGNYLPNNLPFSRFEMSLDAFYDRADVVIAHGGYASTIEILRRGIPLVSVTNDELRDGHQREIVSRLHKLGHLIWCRDVKLLSEAVGTALSQNLKPYKTPMCAIGSDIRSSLDLPIKAVYSSFTLKDTKVIDRITE